MTDFEKELRRGNRILSLFVAMPVIILVAIYGGGWVPARWRNLYSLLAAAAILSAIAGIPVREHLRRERRSGLVPRKPGFAGKLELAAEKMRAHAALVDEEGTEAGGSPVLQSYLTELQRVAKAQDGFDLVPGVRLECKGNPSEHAARLRAAASEIEAYAQRVKMKGGVFHLDASQRIAGAAVIVAMVAWGAWLMAQTWSTPSATFLGGALLVAFGALLGFGLVRSQTL